MPSAALCMIVRNESKTLRRCLESVRGVVDEIVVGDTGSTDDTVAIADEYKARVISVPWQNDFAGARNRVLQEVRCDWVLCLDADEMLDPETAPVLYELGAAADIAGYQVSIRNYVLSLDDRIWDRPAKPNNRSLREAQVYPAYVDHENVRLFRRDTRIFFVGRVHESVGPRIEELGLKMGRAPFLIHHFGLAADAETRARKNGLYRDLGMQKVNEMPGNAQAHLELGLVELDNFGNLTKALECFERACELNPKLSVSWFFAGQAQMRLGEYQKALNCLHKAEQWGHATQAVAEAIGDADYNLGKFTGAARAYRKALTYPSRSTALESKLGLALVRRGNKEEGLEKLRAALKQRPQSGELHDRLILALVWLEQVSEAAVAAENKLRNVPGTSASDFVRAARLLSQQGDWARATAILHVGKQLHRDALLDKALGDLASQQGTDVNQLVTALQNSGKDPRRN